MNAKFQKTMTAGLHLQVGEARYSLAAALKKIAETKQNDRTEILISAKTFYYSFELDSLRSSLNDVWVRSIEP